MTWVVTVTCAGCGTNFDVKPYRLRRASELTCSVACRRRGKEVPCATCGRMVYRKRAEMSERNFCSRECTTIGTATNLQPPPKGVRRSPHTEFQPGHRANNLPVGTERVWPGASGGLRAWVKVAEPSVWQARSIFVWEASNGPVPDGHVIHHENRNTLDDRLDNLKCLTRAAHLAEHRQETP